MTGTWWIHDRLVVGAAPTNLVGLFAFTDRPDHALRVIQKRATAVVPSFEVAEVVLRLAGWAEDDITWQIASSKGDLPVSDDPDDWFPAPPADLRVVP
ncbi:MAG: hypothetical protein Q8R60_06760 [Mycobacteriales bacterium]|nr:hypothetical protein [Mycobacteriales bacterium]